MAVSACTAKEGGAAVRPDQAVEPTSTVVSPSESAGRSTASLDPCKMLSAAELTGLGATYSRGEVPAYGEAGRTCQWVPKLSAASNVLPVVAVYVWDEQGLNDVHEIDGRGVRRGALNGREVAQAPGPDGCLIALAVSATSRVDVVVSSVDVSRQDRCSPAEKIAEIVELKLPDK
ncbi:DUF3558 family protein [Prauserella oleivorans]|uniref:DUF3558 family protein n=2 Tax=Prauserella oleivorans TaxID=1478153 RepID=A0ABW5WI03_9PSEU